MHFFSFQISILLSSVFTSVCSCLHEQRPGSLLLSTSIKHFAQRLLGLPVVSIVPAFVNVSAPHFMGLLAKSVNKICY